MDRDFDVCIIGSGAGGGPVAWTLARAGYSVLVLEKGPWLSEKDLFKDELAAGRRAVYWPRLRDEQHVIESPLDDGGWDATPTSESGWNFWNGNMVGGASNLMSGFFHRLKPVDFRLRSEFGLIDGANVADWPIDYDTLEPWYAMVESVVGVSGKVEAHPHQEPRSTPDFPFPPTTEHPISSWIDDACHSLNYHPVRVPRAILPVKALGRNGCSYSGYCGSYGCSTGAKGSSRAALLDQAVAGGRCEVRPHAKVFNLASDASGKVVRADYYDHEDKLRQVDARLFVVACQPIESVRLMMCSTGPAHPNGIGNRHDQLGRNLVFSAGGSGTGYLTYAKLDGQKAAALKAQGPFVNRALQDWYVIDDPDFGARAKGGTIDFLFGHPNAVPRAEATKWQNGELLWGAPLKRKLERWFSEDREIIFEVFNDWLPTDDCFVTLDPGVKDRWGTPVAKVRIGYHPHDLKVGNYLAERGQRVLERMGADWISTGVSGSPPPNLVAGGCRFGTDPATSVLDPDCRVHGVENLFVTDGSFMPTGGSVPYTWTVYANAFRVADLMVQQLGGVRA